MAIMYLVFSVVMFVFKYLFRGYINKPQDVGDLLKLPFKSLPGTPYWYLYILVTSYILAALFLKQNWDKRIVIAVSLMSSIVYSILEPKEIISAQRVFFFFFFFMLGCLFRLTGRFILEKYYFLQFILAAILGWMILYRGNDLSECIISIIRIFISVIVINALFGISKKYWDHKGFFSYLGERSLEIYIVHVYVTSGIRPILKMLYIVNFGIAVIIATLLGLMLPIIGSYILKKMKLWDLFFKPITYFAGHRQHR